MEPEPSKATTKKHGIQEDNEDGKLLLESHPPHHSSSSASSSSSSLSLEFGIEEQDSFGSPKSGPEPRPTSSLDGASTPARPWSMLSTSPPPEYGPASGQPVGYDPNRIPSSIFSARPNNPNEWSAASNESLFSIQMGNNSFSRDHAILYGKSGELRRLDEWGSTPPAGGLPPVMEGPTHDDCGSSRSGEVSRVESFGQGMGVQKCEEEKMCTGDGNVVKPGPPPGSNLKSTSTPRTSASNARMSEESGNSSSSFAFPVLVSDGVKSGSSRKVTDIPEEPKLEAQVSKSTFKAPEQRWFCRFCCWRRCC